ncbi:MAG: hypothetical protein ONB07_08230 [candidate division KSB1 bacterium]|nr:hypothetical protein [candidate division KSB1 bacterium]
MTLQKVRTVEHRPFIPHTILIEAAVEHAPLTRRVLERLPQASRVVVPEARPLLEPEGGQHGQGLLVLAEQRGRFLKPCPGTKDYICCGYLNLNVATGCTIGCDYCILQSYLGWLNLTVFANTEQLWRELDEFFTVQNRKAVRIGTGELTDSLVFEHLVGLNEELIRYFADKKNALLELKTKSDQVEALLALNHGRRTVLSWSLNSEEVASLHEPGSAPVARRLEAARLAQEAGYRLGFHFDPLVWYKGWQEGYAGVVDQVFSVIRPKNIAWISLGALRYPPALDELIRARHPHCDLPLGELLPGRDGKFRYFRPLREEMYRFVYNRIRRLASDVLVYLCMESDVVWRRALGWSPGNSAGLARLLDERVFLP